MEVLIRTVCARRPNGAEVLIDEYCEFVDMSPRRTGTDYVPGPKRFALRSGESVNVVDETTLQIRGTGEILRILATVSPHSR